jgi:predicted nucleotidyltransferase
MDEVLRKFRDDAVQLLGSSLVCLVYHGSRAKCEAHAESDYDSIIVVEEVNARTIKAVQKLLQRNPGFTTYLLGLGDIDGLPKGHLLEFLHAKPLYGKVRVDKPSKDEVRQYISHCRRDELSSIRHWLVLSHPQDKKARVAYYELKFVYVYLSYLAFIETGKLPPTRKETIAYFENRKEYSLGIKLLHTLDDWENCKIKVAKNPDRYLFMLERFFRNARP